MPKDKVAEQHIETPTSKTAQQEVHESRRGRRRRERTEKKQMRNNEKKGLSVKWPKKHTDMKSLLGYEAMFRDGICKIEEGYYSTCFDFEDVSYQDARQKEQEEIFHGWEQALNTIDSETDIQMTFLTKKMAEEKFQDTMFLPMDDDEVKNEYRRELNTIISDEMAHGDHDYEHHRWITLSQVCKNHAEAADSLMKARDTFLRDLEDVGSDGEKLFGADRLRALNNITNPDDEDFNFDYSELGATLNTTHDYIAPPNLDRIGNALKFGDWTGQVLCVNQMVRSVKDSCLSDFVRLPMNMLISMHIKRLEQTDALDFVNVRENDLKASKGQKLKRNAARHIYGEDMLPSSMQKGIDVAADLRDDLESKSQCMFKLTFLFFPFSQDEQELKANVEVIKKLGRRYSMRISAPFGMQRAGFKSALPLGKNWIAIERQLTTSPLAAYVPFTSEELIQPGGGFFGLDQLSKNPIIFSRKTTASPNGWIVGKPGRGKSYAAKQAIFQDWLSDPWAYFDIIDPEREFTPIAGAASGLVVHISASSETYINPFDLDMNYSDEDAPLEVKMEFIYSLIGFMAGGLTEKQKSIVDKVVRVIYQPFFNSNNKMDLPILSNLHEELLKYKDPDAQDLAITIDRYVNGTMRVFNHHTNVNLDNRMIVWDIKDLGKDMRSVGLLVVLDQIWNRIVANRDNNINSYFYVDEWQLLLKNAYAIDFFDELWSRSRKWGAIPTAITQNVARIVENDTAAKMLSNSDFLLMLGQSDADAKILQEMFSLSPKQKSYICGKRRKPGSGLFFAEDRIIPFINRYPDTSKLHKLFDTKFKDRAAADFAAYGILVAQAKKVA